MFGYYLDLAWRSLKRTPILTALMVLAIGLGIGASMTMLTVLHVMSGDPLPGRSAKLFVPMLDPRPAEQGGSGRNSSSSTPNGFTWADATNLLRSGRADRQAAMNAGGAAVRPARTGMRPFFERGEYVTSDFFAMFGMPFQAGAAWSAAQDRERARVVVLNAELARKLFGNTSAIGQAVNLDDTDFQVIGVLGDWHPQPKFYAQQGVHVFGGADQFFLPLDTAMQLKMDMPGQFACWGSGGDARTSDHCTWLQYWVELDSSAKVTAYHRFLDNYWREQQEHGRFPRTNAVPRLYDLMAWLVHEQVIPANLSMQMWLAIGFLIVAMLSVVALLLGKFLRRSGEISVRRALGARKRDIFAQFAIESAVIGVAGGLLGLLIAQFGLWSVRQRPDGYAQLAQMDVSMLVATVVLAIVASIVAGLLPAWRACHVPPAMHLKTL